MSPADQRRAAAAVEQRDDTPLHRVQPQPSPAQSHLRLVDRQSWFRAYRRQVLVGLFITCAAVMCFALVTLHVLIAENQFSLDQLQQQATAQQDRYTKLRLQVAQLEAPSRIVSLDEGRLNMVQPGSVTYLPAISASSHGAAAASAGTQGSSPTASGPAARRSSASSTVPAPSGDADWPTIKPYLSGNP